MKTVVLPLDPQHPDPAALERAAEVLRAGGLVAFPTETVYGLGANALDADAVARIYAAKGRPSSNPLIVHLADAGDVGQVAAEWPEKAARLAERFWPGPLTLVLRRGCDLPSAVTAGGPTVALRIPAHPVARELVRRAGVPVAAPSANRSGLVSPTRADHVLRGLDGRIDMLLDAGPTAGGLESTVLDLTAEPPRLLRPGLLSPAELEAVVGPVARATPVADESAALPSPGMLSRHYAPQKPLRCVADGPAAVAEEVARGRRVGWVARDVPSGVFPVGLRLLLMPRDPAGYASQLYAVLHELDAADVDVIIVDLPPDDDAWLAVHDRLRRASASP